ncbi:MULTISPECIES: hypothetical protein [Actinosynnema]|uniref:hypothetical protein n=1 Tax=Actinosynnema TaxID=40566 RepID=UPI0020A3033C|nr:hypothetical protein [Actinosynnema pretiosum]MCP2099978.1 hypothetical protein [Actinosynnema pretiosum]
MSADPVARRRAAERLGGGGLAFGRLADSLLDGGRLNSGQPTSGRSADRRPNSGRPTRRRLGGGLAAVVALLWALLLPAPASAAACDGVTVVVDFGALGGVRTGCAPGDPATGIAALNSAGFAHSYVPRQPGLVCQIAALPNPCNGAPASAYWSYWHAPAGGSWTYSSSGAGAYNPAPGTVEGWAFGAGSPPAQAPPAPAPQPAPPQQPAPQQPQVPQPAPPAAQPDSPTTAQAPPNPATPDAPGSQAPAPPTGESAASSAPAATESTQPGESSTPPSTPPADDTPTPVPAAQATETGGRTVGWLAGVLLIAALAGLGVWTARRRAAQ